MSEGTTGSEEIVRSPCVRICRFGDEEDRCLGCLRTRAEVRDWFRMPEDAKRKVVEAIPGRMRERFERRRAVKEASAS